MLCQSFLSPQVKLWAIISYKHGIYEFLNKLPNDLRSYEINKQQEIV